MLAGIPALAAVHQSFGHRECVPAKDRRLAPPSCQLCLLFPHQRCFVHGLPAQCVQHQHCTAKVAAAPSSAPPQPTCACSSTDTLVSLHSVLHLCSRSHFMTSRAKLSVMNTYATAAVYICHQICRPQTVSLQYTNSLTTASILNDKFKDVSSVLLLHRWMRDKFQARATIATAAVICSNSAGTTIRPALTRAVIVPLQRRLLVTLLTALFYFYPSLVTTTLSLFACYQLDYQPSSTVSYPLNARVGLCTTCTSYSCMTVETGATFLYFQAL